MGTGNRGPYWYKEAVIYGLDVATFRDSDGDGVGDFQGLRSKLDYIASLGVTCLWLLPFFPSPNKDNGYDIVDYYNVDRRLGTLGDFVAFMGDASARGLQVMVDLVVHHTSDQHPWFQAARADKDSIYRDFYVWTDEPPEETSAVMMFPDAEDSVWTFDEDAGTYYLHQFYAWQPDLNVENPALRQEIRKILGLWLELGAAAFRVDSASHMLGVEALKAKPERQPHEFLRFVRDCAAESHGAVALLAETDVEPEGLGAYFGEGHEMHLLYNFLLDNYLFLAFARQDAEPIKRALAMLPEKPRVGQWMNFLRNLDELDLERLSESERQEVYDAFAPDEDMRVFGRGIRRRLAPMLGGDRRRLELAYSLLFSLPGTSMLVYGDEIGMGEDLSQSERKTVRTPMQWSAERNGGFSEAPAGDLPLPVISDGPYGFRELNVVTQRRESTSFLNWMKRVIHMRRQCPEIGFGDFRVIEAGERAILAHRCDWEHGTVVAVHNLAPTPCSLSIGTEEVSEPVVEIFGDTAGDTGGDGLKHIDLDGFGYRWFRCGGVRL